MEARESTKERDDKGFVVSGRCQAESNRCSRFCRPVPNRSAIAPDGIAKIGSFFGFANKFAEKLQKNFGTPEGGAMYVEIDYICKMEEDRK